MWVRCSFSATGAPCRPGARGERKRRRRKVEASNERVRDKRWGEIRWIPVSLPHTQSAQDSDCSFVSVSGSFPAGSEAL